MRMRHMVICGLPRSTIFLHIISQTARFNKNVIERKTYFDFSTPFEWIISDSKNNRASLIKKYIGLHTKY